MGAPSPEPASKPNSKVERALGHTFRDRALLELALTHASTGKGRDNQRLEFLGDSLLNCAVALLIHRERPDWEEGPMSKLRGLLVCTKALSEWAGDLGLALRQGGRRGKGAPAFGPKPLADAVEALLAAAFLDAQASGLPAFETVFGLVERRFLGAVREAHPGLWEVQDAKTTLQERAAALGLEAPRYALVDRSGPDHAPRFTARAEVQGQAAEGTAGTLKKAEAEAARRLLETLGRPEAGAAQGSVQSR